MRIISFSMIITGITDFALEITFFPELTLLSALKKALTVQVIGSRLWKQCRPKTTNKPNLQPFFVLSSCTQNTRHGLAY